jgi:hypothetical protein
MTLKEKFTEILTAFWISNWEDECIKIADDYAVEFAEWVDDTILKDPMIYYNNTGKELLEIFKKEKGL